MRQLLSVGWLKRLLVLLYALPILAVSVAFLINAELGGLLFVAAGLVTQFLFLMLRGNPLLLEPVMPRRLLLPSAIAGLMLSTLIFTLLIALSEVFELNEEPTLMLIFAVCLPTWVLWTFVFMVYGSRVDSLRALRRMVVTMIAGSLLQLLATVPSHLVVSRRPGCLVGIGTMIGIMGGVFVLFWAFGPGIVLMFLFETRRRQPGRCPGCGYNLYGLGRQRCPECGRGFTFEEVRSTPEAMGFEGAADGPSRDTHLSTSCPGDS